MFRLLMTVALLGMATLGAQAAPPKPLIATDVQCSGCVNQQDIAVDAVGATQIQQDAVGSSEIAQASVGETELSQGFLSRISAVENSVAAGHQGPLTAVFSQDQSPTSCQFIDLRSGSVIRPDELYRVVMLIPNPYSGSNLVLANNVPDPKRRAVEMLIRINLLPLTPDDFRDPTTGEWNCTNERLLSLW